MRKSISLLCLLLILLACSSNKQDELLGLWFVNDPFLKASFEIIEEDGALSAFVLHYNDGTTRYKQAEGQPKQYAFKRLQYKDGLYVDAISGASSKNETAKPSISIEQKHKDTLEVSTYFANQAISNIWIRKN